MKDVYQYKDFTTTGEVVFKDVDGKKGIVTGYFAHFDNVDADGDIIRHGAFTKTIKETGPASKRPRIKHLLNHDPSLPLGVLTDLKEDAQGLYYESRLGTHSLGQDFVKMAESGLITEHSIGFRTLKRNQLQDYEGYMKNPDKGWFEITEVKLWEGSSLTAWGANEMTPLTGMKSISVDLLIKKSEAIEKFCRNSTATDETIELLLIHNKQLTQAIMDLTQPAKSVEPNKIVKGLEEYLLTFKN